MPARIWHGFETMLDYPVNLIVRHFEKRMTELCMATIMFGIGTLLFLSPESLETSSLRYLLGFASVWFWMLIFFVGGVARIIALAINGHWMPQGGYVRAAGAALGSFVWAQWGAALYDWGAAHHSPIQPGVIVYFVLCIFEMINAYRALLGTKDRGNGRAY